MAKGNGVYSYMVDWLGELGYAPDTRMAGAIAEWEGWYAARNAWYDYTVQRGQETFPVHRESLHPAAAVAEEWSNLLMNERLDITSPDEEMAGVIGRHFAGFGVGQAEFVARSFALGTGAWAISAGGVSGDGLANPHADIRIAGYTGGQVMPLTWSADGCTQCAFASRVEVGGKDYDQCQVHVLVGGTYHILTQLFDTKGHRRTYPDEVLPDLDTKSPLPTFAIVRPSTPNTLFESCAMGASVFAKGISAIKATDEALTSFLTHMRVGRPKMFVADTMVAKRKVKAPDGTDKTVYDAFGEADDIVYRVPPGEEGAKQMDVIQPSLCVAENEEAVSAGLKMLALTCGLGDNYWSWDGKAGLKTATEVVSDSSMLVRSLRKHQNALERSVVRLVRGVAGVCRHLCGTPVDPCAEVRIDFDDSIITDVNTDKNMALAEISILGVPALIRRYLVQYHDFTEEEAAEAVPDEAAAADPGY